MEIAVYFKNGSVAYFKEVENFSKLIGIDDEAEVSITFDYFGIASQQRKRAEFYIKNISGYAVTKKD